MTEAIDLGISDSQLIQAYDLVQQTIGREPGRGAAMLISRYGKQLEARVFGLMGSPKAESVQPTTIFLVASPTKPITALAVYKLIEKKLISLDQPVNEIIPELSYDKKEMQIIHTLTHTSGLPDSLPDNNELRASKMPFQAWLEKIYKVPLDFRPGTNVQYQSLGFALQAEIVSRISGMSLSGFLSKEVFDPLGMKNTFLGLTTQDRTQISDVIIPPEQFTNGWTWNDDYWRAFGSPWGGLFSTVGDYERILRTMLNGGIFNGKRIFSQATTAQVTSNNLGSLPDLNRSDKIRRAWGLGWMLRQSIEPSPMGNVVSEHTFGHWGATGTVVWADPNTELILVLFTNQPKSLQWLGNVSNAVARSLSK